MSRRFHFFADCTFGASSYREAVRRLARYFAYQAGQIEDDLEHDGGNDERDPITYTGEMQLHLTIDPDCKQSGRCKADRG